MGIQIDTQGLLTPKQEQILSLAITGDTAEEIAETVSRTPSTVRAHILESRFNLGAKNLVQALYICIEKGYLKHCALAFLIVFGSAVSGSDSTLHRMPRQAGRRHREFNLYESDEIGGFNIVTIGESSWIQQAAFDWPLTLGFSRDSSSQKLSSFGATA